MSSKLKLLEISPISFIVKARASLLKNHSHLKFRKEVPANIELASDYLENTNLETQYDSRHGPFSPF